MTVDSQLSAQTHVVTRRTVPSREWNVAPQREPVVMTTAHMRSQDKSAWERQNVLLLLAALELMPAAQLQALRYVQYITQLFIFPKCIPANSIPNVP